jgi:phosphopantetheine adenylyltransferase
MIELRLNGSLTQTLTNCLVLSGSFNPLHEGHLQMMQAASLKYPQLLPVFELSISNADKGCLANSDIDKRVKQFSDRGLNIALTNAPLFS